MALHPQGGNFHHRNLRNNNGLGWIICLDHSTPYVLQMQITKFLDLNPEGACFANSKYIYQLLIKLPDVKIKDVRYYCFTFFTHCEEIWSTVINCAFYLRAFARVINIWKNFLYFEICVLFHLNTYNNKKLIICRRLLLLY